MIDFKTLVPHNRTPWPRIKEYLCKNYEILDYFEISQYDFRLDVMSKFWERYNNFVFGPNQRIIITQCDIQYYLPQSKISLGLYNLFLIFNYFNIPSDFLIFLVADDSELEIRFLTKYFNLPECKNIVKLLHFEEFISSKYKKFNPVCADKIEKHFICLNGNQRPHKLDFLCLLEEKNILCKTIHSYNFKEKTEYHRIDNASSIDFHKLEIELVYTDPFNKSNERYTKSQDVNQAYLKHKSKFMFKNFQSGLIDIPYHERTRWETPDTQNSHFIQKAAINLVVETAINYPYPFITEKTWKAIVYSRPFLIVGPPGCLKLLQSYGFKTFDCFWDESYDNILDTSQRLCYITTIVEKLSNLPLIQLQELVLESQEIFKHNFNNYINNFGTVVIDDIIKKLESND